MSSITQRGDKWRALVRRRGAAPATKTFTLRADAERWAREIESRIDRTATSDFSQLRDLNVGQLLTKFRDEVVPTRKGEKWEYNRLNSYLMEPWSHLTLVEDLPAAIRVWRDARLKTVSSHTVVRDFSLLGSVFSYAMKEWGVKLPFNPIHRVQRPKHDGTGERDQVWSDAHLQLFLDRCQWAAGKAPQRNSDYLAWVMLIARYTGLRLGEICRIEFSDIDLSVPVITFQTTKNGDAFNCPLSSKAKGIVSALLDLRRAQIAESGSEDRRLIDRGEGSMGEEFRRVRRELVKIHPELADQVLHSLRHTYTTEVVPRVIAAGGNIMTVQRITGRRSTRSLERYFRPAAGDLAKMLG